MSLDPGARVGVKGQRPLRGQRAGGPGDERDLAVLLLGLGLGLDLGLGLGLGLRGDGLDRVADVFCAELDVGQESLRESDVAGLVGLGVEEGWEERGVPVELGAVFVYSALYSGIYKHIHIRIYQVQLTSSQSRGLTTPSLWPAALQRDTKQHRPDR